MLTAIERKLQAIKAEHEDEEEELGDEDSQCNLRILSMFFQHLIHVLSILFVLLAEMNVM